MTTRDLRVFIIGLLWLASCSAGNTDGEAGAGEPSFELTSHGVGDARLGMTVGELEETLGEGFTVEPLSDNIYSVRYEDEPMYTASFLPDTGLVIDIFEINNPRVVTANGMRVGITLGDAVELLGEPVVTGQFGLESIAFPDAPIDLLADATTAGETVGLYDDPSAIHSAFDPAATTQTPGSSP